MYKNNFAVFDLETGGLIKKDGWIPPITEIAICAVSNDLNDIEEYSTLIVPYKEDSQYESVALQVSNITLQMCREKGKDADEVIKDLIALFTRLKANGKKPVLAGHNIDEFDIIILDNFFTEHKLDISKYVETKFTIDTKWWGRMKYPDNSGYTLGDCLQQEGIDIVNAHRALVDTRANKDLFVKWMKCLRGEGNVASATENKSKFRTKFKFQIKRKDEQ